MPFEPLKTFCRTLRFRLTLWNTTVVLVVVGISLAAIRGGLQLTLSHMGDQFLQEELSSAVLDIEQLGTEKEVLHEQLNQRATGHPRRGLFVQIFDSRGALLWSSAQAPPLDAVPATAQALDGSRLMADHRILGQRLVRPGQETLTVRVGCSLEQGRLELARFTRMLLAAALVPLLLAPLGGYLLAGRATRPLARIIATTARLHPSHLDERLPLRGTQDELDQLSRTINGFLDRIAVYLRQSREFTANAAHELRSPLTALQSSLEIALNAERTVAEYQEVLAVLLEECNQLRVLVNQLLLLAEEDAGRLRAPAEPVRLDQVVRSSVEMFQVVAEAAEVELAARAVEPVLIQGDGIRLWQVVNNLVDNAIKFTPAGGRVALSFRLDDGSGQAVLRVTDTGVGIAEHDLPRIFDRFFQGDKARERENPSRGVGLGLSICQAVVAAHGGTIEAASTLGAGTTFTVRLPGCTRPAAGATNPVGAVPETDRPHVAEST